MGIDDHNDIAAALAHITRIAMRHDAQDLAFDFADALFELCQVDHVSMRKKVIASAGQYFASMESVQ